MLIFFQHLSVMSAEQFIAEANDLFVDEDFEGALSKFNEAISMNDKEGNYFTKRSACYYKLSRYSGTWDYKPFWPSDALSDAQKAVELSPNDSSAFLRKGYLWVLIIRI